MKERLNGLHFFSMSQGQYSDYCMTGLYVCDHTVTEQEWHQFCRKESAIREEMRKQMCPTCNRSISSSEEYAERGREIIAYQKWARERGSHEAMFAALHGMIELESTELHLDY